MAIKRCVVLDIETIPSQKAILDSRESEFKLPIFHQIACMSYVVLNNEFGVQKFEVLGGSRESEQESLVKFGKLMGPDTLLVTWGGRRFDIPVILYRSMYYGVPCPWYFKKDFSHRYDLSGHVDIKDHMSLFGATDNMSLDHVAAVLGMPGKVDVKGSEVNELWARNRYKSIGSYCVSDVLTTMIVFLKWSVVQGLASPQEVNDSLDSIKSYALKLESNAREVGTDYISTDSEVLDGIRLVTDHCSLDSMKIGGVAS